MTNKEQYAQLCANEKTICVFMRPFWMDAVCGPENWDVLLHLDGEGKINAAWPYYFQQKGGRIEICHPQQTQIQGVWFAMTPDLSVKKRLSWEKEILFEMIDELEKLPILSYYQQMPLDLVNWQPFYWKGYSETTRYTYRIEDISDPERVLNGFDGSKRQHVKQALKHGISVKFDMSAEDFYANHKQTLALQGARIGYGFEVFKRMYDAVYANNAGRTLCAFDNEGNVHGALFNIWDENSAYDLITTFDPRFRKSGASSLLIYEMIKFLSGKVRSYDFEGSMVEGIATSFRQLGGVPVPYYAISKDNHSPIYKAMLELWHGRRRLFGV